MQPYSNLECQEIVLALALWLLAPNKLEKYMNLDRVITDSKFSNSSSLLSVSTNYPYQLTT